MSQAVTASEHPQLEFRNMHVMFGSQHVLRNINLSIPRGQTVAIIGESGCGKTVMLKTSIGLVRPTRGNVFFDGSDLNRLIVR
jgi:phospholipid/cholesterol/gamma-HCH transport system ATP-binding protein